MFHHMFFRTTKLIISHFLCLVMLVTDSITTTTPDPSPTSPEGKYYKNIYYPVNPNLMESQTQKLLQLLD